MVHFTRDCGDGILSDLGIPNAAKIGRPEGCAPATRVGILASEVDRT